MNSLRFRPDGSFTLVQFTDAHFTDLGEKDRRTQALMASVLDRVQPDLVVLTGDIIAGGPGRDPAAGYAAALKPIEERNLPWASVMGNHDDEGSMDRAQLMAWQRGRPGCLNQPGPAHLPGQGHFVLEPRTHDGNSAAARLYFLDSLSYVRKGAPTEYAFITQPQIDWFLSQPREPRLPGLAFFHIPLPEHDEVWNRGPCLGQKHEAVCCPRVNSGFFQALVRAGDVRGVFVGHDHVNDYEGELEGIRLVYGRATGFGGYGRDGFPRGGRVIRLREGEPGFSTELALDQA